VILYRPSLTEPSFRIDAGWDDQGDPFREFQISSHLLAGGFERVAIVLRSKGIRLIRLKQILPTGK
jgi:hypothetical protein